MQMAPCMARIQGYEGEGELSTRLGLLPVCACSCRHASSAMMDVRPQTVSQSQPLLPLVALVRHFVTARNITNTSTVF